MVNLGFIFFLARCLLVQEQASLFICPMVMIFIETPLYVSESKEHEVNLICINLHVKNKLKEKKEH